MKTQVDREGDKSGEVNKKDKFKSGTRLTSGSGGTKELKTGTTEMKRRRD